MLFKSRAERRRSRVVSQAHLIGSSLRELSALKLKLRWSQLQVRLDGASPKRRRAMALEVMPEALALAREAGRRAVGLEAYPVQMLGAVVLADGLLAEMRTGEGKTLVAAIGAAVGALFHRHVHVVTVNEYLAQRDATTMRPLFDALGLTCGVVLSGQAPAEKRDAYGCNVTYGVNSELGFDYLRDNMVTDLADKVQPRLADVLAVIDEADAILIDEARTPLIITQQSSESLGHLPAIARFVDELSAEDFELEERHRRVHFTDRGYARAEAWMLQQGWLSLERDLYGGSGMRLLHRLEAALKARTLYRRDEHYLITADRKVAIIDEGTGRIMADRRWSDGLHQAVEAREGVPVMPESETLASISYQHFFRLYGKRAGLTGTAWTEREELEHAYGLLVVRIPTNRPPQRIDRPDLVYGTKQEKYVAVVEDVVARHRAGQPVLLGTPSVDVSERLSSMLRARGVAHELLNARHHAREAQIVAQAGRPGAVTVATNMAGRGTDIVLGGNIEQELQAARTLPEVAEREARIAELSVQWNAARDRVLAAGGLYVLGAERHESRRIDNQLRGRSGRQGDPGESRFYLSLEDDLLRVFGSGLGKVVASQLREGEALEHTMLSRSIEAAQKRRENTGYNQRKELLKFDQVSSRQRDAVYGWRDEILAGDANEVVGQWLEEVLEHVLDEVLPSAAIADFIDVAVVLEGLHGLHWEVSEDWVRALVADRDIEAARTEVRAAWRTFIVQRLARVLQLTDNNLRLVLISAIDDAWRAQMGALDDAREGVHLQSYAQQDPTRAYMRLGATLFDRMCLVMRYELCRLLAAIEARDPSLRSTALEVPVVVADAQGVRSASAEDRGSVLFVRRNARCACGSGRRHKHCHGSLAVGNAQLAMAAL